MTIPPDQMQQICKFKSEFSNLTFFDAFERIKKLTEPYPIVLREQYRLFCGLCIYKSKRNIYNKPKLPSQLANFQDRLLANYKSLSMAVIQERWANFGNQSFITSLESISKGCPEINQLINIIKIPADSISLIKYLEEHQEPTLTNPNLKLQLYKFLPEKPITFNNRLITAQQYRNFQ